MIETNGERAASPELVNSDPYGAGWMIGLRIGDVGQVDGLLDPTAYERLVTEA